MNLKDALAAPCPGGAIDIQAIKWAVALLKIHPGVAVNENSQYWLGRLRAAATAAPCRPALPAEPSEAAIESAMKTHGEWWVPPTAERGLRKRMFVETLRAAYAAERSRPSPEGPWRAQSHPSPTSQRVVHWVERDTPDGKTRVWTFDSHQEVIAVRDALNRLAAAPPGEGEQP